MPLVSNRRNNPPSPTRRHSTASSAASSAECALRREDRVNATAKVGPSRRESFPLRRAPFGVKKRPAVPLLPTRPDALCSGCLKFTLSVLYHRAVSLYSLFLRFYALFRRVRRGECAAILAAKCHSRVPSRRRKDVERRGYFAIQRKTFHGEVDWLFGFAEPWEERRLLAGGEKREQCPAAHLCFCLDERMEIALL